jgi:3-hydroxyisobutyrate dehydrogenase
MNSNLSVAFIGLGQMGLPMVMSLLRANIEVHVYDLAAADNIKLAKNAGAIHEDSLEKLASSSIFIITMLPSGEVLRDILFGEPNLKSFLRSGSILLDMSTSNPKHTQLTHAELASLNISMMDAPVMGGVAFAKDASLDFLVGGDNGLIEKCRPIFDAIGRSVTHCGPIGSGHALKALTNYVNAAAMMTAVEALSIGRAFGMDEDVMSKSLIETCTGRNHPIVKKVIPKILTGSYDSGMAIGLLEKDLKIAADIALQTQSEHPLLDESLEILSEMVQSIGASKDQTEIAKYWRK